MADVKNIVKIGEKVFELRVPVRAQIKKAYEALANLNIDIAHLESIGQASDMVKVLTFEAELAAIAYVEQGKTFSESYELNKKTLIDWFSDSEGEIGKLVKDFFDLMPKAISPGK